MYAFGNDSNALPETVNLVEDIVCDYVTELTLNALEVGKRRGKLRHTDFIFLIKGDRKKRARVGELLEMAKRVVEVKKIHNDIQDGGEIPDA